MGVVISFGLLVIQTWTVSLTLPSIVSFNFLPIFSVNYVFWLPVFIETPVIFHFDYSGSIVLINAVCVLICSPAETNECPSSQSSTKGETVLAVKKQMDWGFFCLNSLVHKLQWWLSFSLQ